MHTAYAICWLQCRSRIANVQWELLLQIVHERYHYALLPFARFRFSPAATVISVLVSYLYLPEDVSMGKCT